MKRLLSIFQYTVFAYVLIAAAVLLMVDRDKATLQRLNFLKGIEAAIYEKRANGIRPGILELREAVDFCRQMLMVNPGRAVVRGNLGFCYYHTGDISNALRQYRKAVRLQPRFYPFNFDLGMIYGESGDAKRSRESFKQAAALMPATKIYYVYLSENFKRQNNTKGLLMLSQLIRMAADDQAGIMENLTKEYPKQAKHNTIMGKDGAWSLHFFTMEEEFLLEGLTHAGQ